jgi:lysine 2,3-aminomutase
MSGIGIPTYVVDGPHGAGKIPLMPNYLVSMSDDAVILRNFEGMLIRYQAEDKPGTINPTATRGVSGLIQGDKTALIPEGNERMARRKPRVAPDNCGCDTEARSDGERSRPILPLPLLNSGTGGNGHSASNG